MRVAVAFDHAVRRAALAACLSSDDTSITALAERSQRWPRGREQMRRRGVATVAATAGSSQPIKAQSLVSVLIYQSETRSPTRYDVHRLARRNIGDGVTSSIRKTTRTTKRKFNISLPLLLVI